MSIPVASTAGSAAALSLPQRFIGILFSPKATFESVVAWPRWLGIFLLTCLVVLGAQVVFTSTETGQMAQLDQQIEWTERFGGTVTPEARAKMIESNASPAGRAIGSVIGLVSIFLIMALCAGALFGVFAILGGTASYKQVLAVQAHAGVVFAVSTLFALPMWFRNGSMSGVSNLGVFWPGDEESFLARFLGTVDVFFIWWLFVLAIGLGVLYRRRTQPVFLGLMAVYVLVGIAIAGVMSAVGG